jgi:hypothetical protein
MKQAHKLRKSEVPATLLAAFPDYKGRKFTLEVAETVTLHDLNCNRYALVALDGHGSAELPRESPWDPRVEGKTFAIPSGFAVVEHTHFCGKDMGLRFHVSPSDAPRMLPSASNPPELGS